MDTNKMREQFEAWALSAKAHGEHFDLSRGNHGAYQSPVTHWLYCSWVASYQASREAVVVELPNHFRPSRQEVVSSIEAQGLKVNP